MQELHAVRPVADSRDISPDGQKATIKVLLVGGAIVTLTLPTNAIDAWASEFNELFHLLRRMRYLGGGVILREPSTFGVTTSPDHRGCVLFGFDPETPKETSFKVPGLTALDFGRQVLAHAADVLTPAERKQALGQLPADVRPRGRIILPPGSAHGDTR